MTEPDYDEAERAFIAALLKRPDTQVDDLGDPISPAVDSDPAIREAASVVFSHARTQDDNRSQRSVADLY